MYFEIYNETQQNSFAGAGGLLGAMQWRWRLRGANHEIVASGESYTTRQSCQHAIDLVRGTTAATPIHDLTNKPVLNALAGFTAYFGERAHPFRSIAPTCA